MEEWKEYKLIDVCSRLKSGKSIKANLVFDKGEFPVIGGNGVRGYTNISNFQGECGVIGRQGAYCGNVRYFEGEFYMTEHAIVVVGNEYADTYYLTSLLSLMHLGNLSAQSAQPGISVQTLSKQNIVLPPIIYQKRVSKILKSLDDKIEVNRRINEQLEELAGALFKSWFVDFEPFKDGEFVESDLGMIPKGWKVISFKDFITPSSEKAFVGDLPEYSVTNNGILPRDEKFKKQLSKTTSKNKVLKKNNLVFGMSREILNWGIMEDPIGGVSSAYNVYIIDEKLIHPKYLRLYMKAKITYFNDLIGNAAREGQSLDKTALLNKIIYLPCKDIWEAFLSKYNTIKEKISEGAKEITHLTTLRDTLLPKLMSGEIDVNEVKI